MPEIDISGHPSLPGLQSVYDRVHALMELQQVPSSGGTIVSWPLPEPGSSLFRDDELTDPYRLSHWAQGYVLSSIEHQHAARALVIGAETLYPAAGYTLYRAAIESASAAVALLSGSTREYRVETALRLACWDIIDGESGLRAAGKEPPVSSAEVREEIRGIATRARIDPGRLRGRVSATSLTKAADDLTGGSLQVHAAWSLYSGIAHARIWPSLHHYRRDESPSAVDGVSVVRTRTDLADLLRAARVSLDLVEEALRVHRLRAARH